MRFNMDIEYFFPHWGSEHLSFDVFAQRVKFQGFSGIEMSLPSNVGEKQAIIRVLQKYQLCLIGQHWETVDVDFTAHKKNYALRLHNLVSAKPVFINTQTGKDYYSFDQNQELIAIASHIERQSGIEIFHETHRGKFSFAAHITREYLKNIPELKITLDASHWCNVAESFLADQPESVQLAIEHTRHIHARVGHTQGPQVPNPQDSLWNEALKIHVGWWRRVLEHARKTGQKKITITPEFGAPPYMTLLPGTQRPIANQWDINVFMVTYLTDAFNIME